MRLLVCLACASHGGPAVAQSADLGPIIINATRVDKPVDDIPAAVGVVGQDPIQLGAEQLGLDESLGRIPGLYFQNRYNFAQDLRASIRGFGARSSFGIRGIKIIVDGIPETLPDGQGSVDGIDIGSASRIVVIRGPASSLYGNASGGAILIETEKGSARPFVEIRPTFGDHDFDKLQFKAGGEAGRLNYLLNLSDTSIDGYREHSEYENIQLNGRLEYLLADDSSLLLSLHRTDQPVANDAGGLTEAEADADPSQARAANLAFDAGEALTQTRLGLRFRTELAPSRELDARIYFADRDFENRLPFTTGGAVDLEREFVGAGIKYIVDGEFAGRSNRLLLGVDFDRQDDDRTRFDNLSGERGAKTFEQTELVTATGVFAQNETSLRDDLELTLGLRYDDIEFDVDDDFLADGDDSGEIGFDQASPMIGLNWMHDSNTRLYATLSTAFETPTTTELANPAGGGFNPDLEPQRSTNYEIGVKANRDRNRFEIALFHIDVDDELTPFELPSQPGRSFFENAGKSDRDGLELAYTRRLGAAIDASVAYTWSDFRFARFTDADGNVFDGNRIPGIPEHLLRLGLSWFGERGFNARWETIYHGELYADNANDVEIDAYHVTNLRLGHDRFMRDWEFAAFVGINNLFDESYNNNIRINAFGGRYFEPAPGRNAFAGFTLRRKFPG